MKGDVRVMMTISNIPHHHDIKVGVPGYQEKEHTSLLLDLTHHNRYMQHHLSVRNTTNNVVKVSVTGDVVGPYLLQDLKPSVSLTRNSYCSKLLIFSNIIVDKLF